MTKKNRHKSSEKLAEKARQHLARRKDAIQNRGGGGDMQGLSRAERARAPGGRRYSR